MADSIEYDFLTLDGDGPQAPPPWNYAANVNVSIKLPKFWKNSPKRWFDYAEAVFAKRHVFGNQRKVPITLAALDEECIRSIMDLVTYDPQYDSIKERLINVYSAPGYTRSPAQFLSDMRAAFPHSTRSVTTSKECEQRKLPPPILSAVSGLDGPLHEVAINVDEILNATGSGNDSSTDDNINRSKCGILTYFVVTPVIVFGILLYTFYWFFIEYPSDVSECEDQP